MPKEKNELKEIDETKFPKRKKIESQWCDRWDSPYPDFQGCIYVPSVLSPSQFLVWWEKKEDESEFPDIIKAYLSRVHIVVEWHIENIQPKQVDDWQKYTSMEVPLFVVSATTNSIFLAQSLPNLAGLSTSGANGKQEEKEPLENEKSS